MSNDSRVLRPRSLRWRGGFFLSARWRPMTQVVVEQEEEEDGRPQCYLLRVGGPWCGGLQKWLARLVSQSVVQ